MAKETKPKKRTTRRISLDSRIKKKKFSFSIRKKFKNEYKYNIKRKYTVESESPKKIIPRIRVPLKLVAILLVLGLLGVWIGIGLLSISGGGAAAPKIAPKFQYTVYSGEILAYDRLKEGSAIRSDVVHTYLSYNTNGTETGFFIYPYDTVDSNEVYILNSQVYSPQSTNLRSFKDELKRMLRNVGYRVTEVSLNNVDIIPDDSILIIPSGRIPVELLDGETNLIDIMNRSIVVIYIGYPFSEAIDASGNIVVPKNLLGFRYTLSESLPRDKRLTVDKPMHMHEPVYRMEYKNTDTNVAYGFISVIRIGNGYLAVFPEYLDSGWDNGSVAAQDVAQFIYESGWHAPLSQKSYTYTNQSGAVDLFSAPIPTTEQVYLKLIGQSVSESKGVKSIVKVLKITKDAKGRIVFPETVYPSYITGLPIFVRIYYQENESVEIFPYIQIISAGRVLFESPIPKAYSSSLTPQIITVNTDLPPGEYELVVRDENRIYAKGMLKIVDVDVKPMALQWVKGRLTFDIRDEYGERVKVNEVEIYVDGEKVGEYRNVQYIELKDLYLSGGEHTFDFVFNKKYHIKKTITYRETNPLDPILSNPFYTFLAIVTIISLVFAFVIIKPREEIIYGLDIPDFPVVKSTTVSVKIDDVLKIFDEVNKDYSWKHMPLKLEEIKKGFLKLSYDGKPIHISDYNLEILLDELVAKGLVYERYYYYLPTKWIEESGKSGLYLILFRMLRDIFVDNVVKFTPLKESKLCDTEITVSGRKMYVHIFDGDYNIIKRALKTVDKGKTLIVFDSESTMNKFIERITVPDTLAVLFKLEVERGTIVLLPITKMGAFIESIKGS